MSTYNHGYTGSLGGGLLHYPFVCDISHSYVDAADECLGP